MNKYQDTSSGSGSKWAAVCQRPGKDSGNVSLHAGPVLRFISKHLLLLGHCPEQTLDSALGSITVMVPVKSPKCEERERSWRAEKGGCSSDNCLQGWIGPASSSWEWLQWDNPRTLTSFKVIILCKIRACTDGSWFPKGYCPNYTGLSRKVCCSCLKKQNKPCRLNKGTQHCPREPPIVGMVLMFSCAPLDSVFRLRDVEKTNVAYTTSLEIKQSSRQVQEPNDCTVTLGFVLRDLRRLIMLQKNLTRGKTSSFLAYHPCFKNSTAEQENLTSK